MFIVTEFLYFIYFLLNYSKGIVSIDIHCGKYMCNGTHVTEKCKTFRVCFLHSGDGPGRKKIKEATGNLAGCSSLRAVHQCMSVSPTSQIGHVGQRSAERGPPWIHPYHVHLTGHFVGKYTRHKKAMHFSFAFPSAACVLVRT